MSFRLTVKGLRFFKSLGGYQRPFSNWRLLAANNCKGRVTDLTMDTIDHVAQILYSIARNRNAMKARHYRIVALRFQKLVRTCF